jgi:hypothetical protein
MWRQPQTNWSIPNPVALTFNQAVQAIVVHRAANPAIAARFNLSTDPGMVANELERFTRQRLGLPPEEAPPPFQPGRSRATLPRLAGAVAAAGVKFRQLGAGAETLVDFVKSKEEAVPKEQAEARASVCARGNDGKKCPKNGEGDWSAWFTQPVSAAIRKRLEQRRGMDLSTSLDAELGVCTACGCPLPLKIHFPLEYVMKHIPNESWNELWSGCWIRKENGG